MNANEQAKIMPLCIPRAIQSEVGITETRREAILELGKLGWRETTHGFESFGELLGCAKWQPNLSG
ncbi:hypothetical protein Metme_2892 [Methylomonas methanica MC09]|uniref:Uncharacterized protein n=2 Tax=Methylomonas methanica TaxID=421 RepID=G0A116_METMM|nr:hypothetical protein Metme_2892 [Methylomonas methanica MC09]